jgi:hypothetical protein
MSATGLFKWLTFLALLLAPFAMIGGSPASAHAQTVEAGHCAETEKPAEAPPSTPVDCMVACAGCLPTPGAMPAALPSLQAAARSAPIAFCLRGLHPEAAIPPPRLS